MLQIKKLLRIMDSAHLVIHPKKIMDVVLYSRTMFLAVPTILIDCKTFLTHYHLGQSLVTNQFVAS